MDIDVHKGADVDMNRGAAASAPSGTTLSFYNSALQLRIRAI